MWQVGTGWKFVEFAGTAGVVTLPKGACIILMIAHASAGGATLQALGGPTVPVINGANPLVIQNYHPLQQANIATGKNIVFTGTDMYYVQAAVPGNV